MNRRSLLRAGVGVAGLGFAGCQELRGCTDEIACFAFEYHGMDDAPSGLEIEHTGGDQQLQADEVFVTSVIEDYETREMKTVAWAELEDDIGPSDTINGEQLRFRLRGRKLCRSSGDRATTNGSSRRGCTTMMFRNRLQ